MAKLTLKRPSAILPVACLFPLPRREPLPTQATVDRVIAEVVEAHRDLHAPQLGIGRVPSKVRKGQRPRRNPA